MSIRPDSSGNATGLFRSLTFRKLGRIELQASWCLFIEGGSVDRVVEGGTTTAEEAMPRKAPAMDGDGLVRR